jgi:ketosteroid isomerase-like protein
MPRIRSICAAVLVAGGLAGLAPAAFAQSIDAEVAAAYAAWDAAFNAGDAAAVGATYADDALFLPATHDVIEGPAAVSEFFATLFGMGVTGHKLELIEAIDGGETVVAAARWSAAGKDAAGADQPWGGVATTVFERQDDGSLKLRLHTFN